MENERIMEASSTNGFMYYATDLTSLSGSAFTVCLDKNDLNDIRKSLGTPVFGGGGGVANNTGADQPAQPRSLISVFVIRILESTIYKLATGEISFF